MGIYSLDVLYIHLRDDAGEVGPVLGEPGGVCEAAGDGDQVRAGGLLAALHPLLAPAGQTLLHPALRRVQPPAQLRPRPRILHSEHRL